MGHKTVASNRPATWSAEVHNGAAAQRMSVDAPVRTDETSRDLAYQFLRMNRAARRAAVAEDHYTSTPPSCVSQRDRAAMVAETSQPQGRRHSSFEPGTLSSLAYRAKEPAQNPRKHQRGSPSLGDIEEQTESPGERHFKRISGDSGYGSDTQRIRCEQSIYRYDRHIVDTEVLYKPKVVVVSCSASDSECDEALGAPRRPKRRLRKHSFAADTKTVDTEAPDARYCLPDSVVESTESAHSLSHSSKGLRRVKGTATLRPKIDHHSGLAKPRMRTTTMPSIISSGSGCADKPSLLLKTSTWSPSGKDTVRSVVQRRPRPVSGPPTLPPNWHTNAIPKLAFRPVEEQSDSPSDSDESSVESSVFSIPNSPVEPCELDQDDPFAPHFDAVIASVLERFRDWQVRQRGGQGGGSRARRPSSNTIDSGRSSRKRSHSELPEHAASDEDVHTAPGFKRPKVPAPPTKTLACPFWKKNPDSHRQCYKKVLSRIKYVKSHLYRFHPAPITCPCCGAEFQSEGVRDGHLRARRCEVVERSDIADHEGLTAERMRQVSRRADPRLSEEEQWFVIWDTIFPNTPRPSTAYIDGALSEDICNFHEFFANSGNDIILHYFSLHDPDFARSDRAALYDRFVRDRVLERIYEQWATRRGLRQPHDTDDFTPPQSIPTESEIPSRASSAHGNPPTQEPAQTYSAEDIQPVPASALQYAGQGFDEADVGDEFDYDSHTQSLFDDLAGMFSGADYH
ncbi:uncharacterized protein LY79DRAFT_43252 [Colletotrichum navitas]|uniref:C2H2-type domain-containing protein n=1 Tax=Colletotrichum navitas TaxID=681940 RepID=A0AAD8PN26_9PEZI|nr:uncharacterized protein LY79DRAFT_43252 [Colletotrichum navitas]KAK1572764.1 hypothetical protein LY79DRAFT_43252 [Colletotrichum navitas]